MIVYLLHMTKANKVTHIDMGRARIDANRTIGAYRPAEDLPAESLEISVPPHIIARRAEARRKKIEGSIFWGTVVASAVVVAGGLAAMSHNSRSPADLPNRVAITVAPGDRGVSDTIRTYYHKEHPSEPVDMTYVTQESNEVVEKELGGNSLVNPGDKIYVDPAN
jgi:hypothetical protein